MHVWKVLKGLLLGYCVGFTAASYLCALFGIETIKLQHSFIGFICFCISGILFSAIKIPSKKAT